MGASAASAGGAPEWARIAEGGVAVAQGGRTVYQGYCMMKEGKQQAAALERQADMQTTLHRMHQLQRLIDDLIASLQEDGDRRTTSIELGNQLTQTQAATQTAAVMRA